MSKKITQEQRLDYLVEEFKADSGEYKDLKIPKDLSDCHIYKQIGNSVTVPVIEAIATEVAKAFNV